jgi:hypothetical protein
MRPDAGVRMPSVLSIRLATNNDIPAIRAFLLSVRSEYGVLGEVGANDVDLDDLELNYFRGGGCFEVVEDAAKRIVGCAGLYPLNPCRAAYFVDGMVKRGIPAVTPPGGPAGHVDATRFLPHIPQSQYIAGALNAAVYIVSGVRGMERGTVSMDRDAQDKDVFSDMELCRLAAPRVYGFAHGLRGRPVGLVIRAPESGGRTEICPRAARAAVLHRPARSARRLGPAAGRSIPSRLRPRLATCLGIHS